MYYFLIVVIIVIWIALYLTNEDLKKLKSSKKSHLNLENNPNTYSEVESKYLEEQKVKFDDCKKQVIDILEELTTGNNARSVEKSIVNRIRNLEYNYATLHLIHDFLDILKEEKEHTSELKTFDHILGTLQEYHDMKIKSTYDLLGILEEIEIKNNKLNDILKNEKTYEIYKQEESNNEKRYKFYIKWSIGIAVCGAILSSVSRVIFTKCWFPQYLCFLEDNSIDYWIMKASIIFIAITGVTFCLKQAIHHQKKRDLAEKNRLELEALPTYMTYFNDEMKTEIYKDLLPKYFGQPIDNTHYTNMNSLIDEQLKLSNEILKSQLNKIGANSDSSTESKSKS